MKNLNKNTSKANVKVEPTRRSERIKLKEEAPLYLEEKVEPKGKMRKGAMVSDSDSKSRESVNLQSVKSSDKQTPCHACEYCETTFAFKSSMIKHQNSVHSQSVFMCNICYKEFARLDSVQRHKEMIHSGSKVTHTCSLCNKLFDYRQNLLKHIKKYHMNI